MYAAAPHFSFCPKEENADAAGSLRPLHKQSGQARPLINARPISHSRSFVCAGQSDMRNLSLLACWRHVRERILSLIGWHTKMSFYCIVVAGRRIAERPDSFICALEWKRGIPKFQVSTSM